MAPVQNKGEIEDFSLNMRLLLKSIYRLKFLILKSGFCKKQLNISNG